MMVALAIPPPSTSSCSPHRPPRCSSAIDERLVSIREFDPCPHLPFRPERASDLKLPCPHILTDLENRSLVLWLNPIPQAALA